jgi:hypothetical protein
MSGLLPEGEELRRAIKWISAHLQDNPDQKIGPLVQEATFKFDLSPKDSDFLLNFYQNIKQDDKTAQ